MILLLAGVLLIVAAFGIVLLRGAPYVPTLKRQVSAALDLLDLKPGQTLLELGCGDGKVLIAAAERGLDVVGIELNPLLVAVCWLRTRRYRKQVRIIWGDFWAVPWPVCDGVFTFLLQRYMSDLDERMQGLGKPLASFAFKIPDRKPDVTKQGVFLYKY